MDTLFVGVRTLRKIICFFAVSWPTVRATSPNPLTSHSSRNCQRFKLFGVGFLCQMWNYMKYDFALRTFSWKFGSILNSNTHCVLFQYVAGYIAYSLFHCRRCNQWFCFQNQTKCCLGTLTQYLLFFIIGINCFRGDSSDSSARTMALAVMQPTLRLCLRCFKITPWA